MAIERRLPIGAELHEGGAHFRVWAPRCRRVDVLLETGPSIGTYQLQAEVDGYCSGFVPGVQTGDRYRFRLDGQRAFPDPTSRFQPEGPHGPSRIVNPSAFEWTDRNWPGVSLPGQVLYELHVGTFTAEGTWDAAAARTPELARFGVSVIEVMPVADFPGRFGWGYDGVNLFAPTRLYGSPDDFRRFVDAAHGVGIGVILDVVYNHLGPDGNYLPEFGPYLADRHKNEWGDNINFDGPDAGPVREYFTTNAAYWIDEFHLDGLRLDATQAIHDESPEHVLNAIQRSVRQAARGRATIVIHENESQEGRMIRPVERGGLGLDGAWNDDFHHSAMVALTGRNEAYYSDYLGRPQEFISTAKYGYLFQGQRYAWQEQRRGSNTFDLEPWRFIAFIQNHDQVANSGHGLRSDADEPRPVSGDDSSPVTWPEHSFLVPGARIRFVRAFLLFRRSWPELAAAVKAGRAEFLRQFRSLDHSGHANEIPDPADPATFSRCKLDFRERASHASIYQLHKDLLATTQADPTIRAQTPRGVDGAVLGPNAFVLRFFAGDGADRLLLVNFGPDLHLEHAPGAATRTPDGCTWELRGRPRTAVMVARARHLQRRWTAGGSWARPHCC